MREIFTDEHEAFRQSVRTFLEREVVPHHAQWEHDGQVSREVWAKEMEDGSHAVGLFNRGAEAAQVTVKWADLGIKGRHLVRDLWRQKDIGKFTTEFASSVPSHGVVLVKIK